VSTPPVFLVGTELSALTPLAGGLERLVCGLAEALSVQGVKTHLVDVSSKDPYSTLRSLPDNATVVLNNRPAWSHWVSGPTVIWLHNTEEAWGDISIRKGALAMAVSHYLAERASSIFASPVKVLPAFVDPQFFERPDHHHARPDPALLFPNRTLEKKGVREVLDALDTEQGMSLRVNFVTNLSPWKTPTPEHTALLTAILAHPRGSLIPRCTTPEDIRSLYRSHSGVLVPSTRPEGFGLVALEALATGVPTIISNQGGLGELGEFGAIFADPRDREALASAMVQATKLGHSGGLNSTLKQFSPAASAALLREALLSLGRESAQSSPR